MMVVLLMMMVIVNNNGWYVEVPVEAGATYSWSVTDRDLWRWSDHKWRIHISNTWMYRFFSLKL